MNALIDCGTYEHMNEIKLQKYFLSEKLNLFDHGFPMNTESSLNLPLMNSNKFTSSVMILETT